MDAFIIERGMHSSYISFRRDRYEIYEDLLDFELFV
jgi:hypothetical protein